MDNRSHSTDLEKTENTPTVNRSRRRTLKALGTLAGVSVAGSGTALGSQLDGLVADGRLATYQAGQMLTEVEKLTASDGAAGDSFGQSVSMSGDGTVALVGALGDDDAGFRTGSAYAYDLTQDPPTETKLTASDPAESDNFGDSVSVSADGTTALVGAWGADTAVTSSGAAYVYDLTQDPPTETKLTASDGAAFDFFGRSVSVSGNGSTALVGASHDDSAGSQAGSAYVYDLTQDPPAETKLTASDAAAGDTFGMSVSLSGDGTTALIGALLDDDGGTNSGSMYVYDLTQGSPDETKLTASDPAAFDAFGQSMSVSGDGSTALVGARNDDDVKANSGSAYVYDLTKDPPAETKLTASDPAESDNFGVSVSVNSDGSTALVGAYLDDDVKANSGSAYVYDLTQDPPTETKLAASDPASSDYFGLSVSVSGDGSTALVGARNDDDESGSAYVFDLKESPKPSVPKRAFQFDLAVGEVLEEIGDDENAYYGRQRRLVQAVSMLADGSLTRTFNHPHGDTSTVVKDGCTLTYGRFHYDVDSGEVSVSVGLAEDCQEKTLTLAGYELPDDDTMFVRAHGDDQELVAYETVTLEPGETVTLSIDVDE